MSLTSTDGSFLEAVRTDWLTRSASLWLCDTTGGLVDNQTKRDLIAGGAILIMFLGAYALTISRLGLLMIASGGIVMLWLFAKMFLSKQ